MTGQELVKKFRELSQDEVTPYLWEDAFVLDCLNEAEREAADRARLIYDDTTLHVPIVSGQRGSFVDPHILDIERAAFHAEGNTRPPTRLKILDRLEIDRLELGRIPGATGGLPTVLVYDGNEHVELVPAPRRNGTLMLGAYRWPIRNFGMEESPEIPVVHHMGLVDWALFRAFSIPDADEANERLAAFYHERFEKYFGRRVDARKRRPQRANKPHVNKLW